MRPILVALGALLALLATPAMAALPVSRATIVRTLPHDPGAFTEGLFFRDGSFFESTGLAGRSDIRQVRPSDGKVLRSVAIPPDLFGEGIIDWNGQIISLTWQSGRGFRWTLANFRRVGSFTYRGEGWGLTRMGKTLVMSDGTSALRLVDPATFAERKRIAVTAEGRPVIYLNELEYVRGEILANIWQTDLIARIDPATGRVKGWIDLSGLPRPASGRDMVANGIAYDAAKDRLYVTGKNWPNLYEIKFAR